MEAINPPKINLLKLHEILRKPIMRIIMIW